jgi:CheY-like chemotaxis protein
MSAADGVARGDERRPDAAAGERGLKVLYIEDDADSVELVRTLLGQHEAVELLARPDGRSGLAAALGHNPDLVLLDLELPDISGVDVLRVLRTHAARDIPVIVMTANPTPQSAAAARAAGVEAYLVKPIALDEFLAVVARLLPGETA